MHLFPACVAGWSRLVHTCRRPSFPSEESAYQSRRAAFAVAVAAIAELLLRKRAGRTFAPDRGGENEAIRRARWAAVYARCISMRNSLASVYAAFRGRYFDSENGVSFGTALLTSRFMFLFLFGWLVF